MEARLIAIAEALSCVELICLVNVILLTDSIKVFHVTVPNFFINYIPKIERDCYSLWNEYFDKRSQEKGILYKKI